jgi:hypothetical protein
MTQSVKAALSRAFRYLLKPLVRLSIRNGLSYGEFSQALKEAYVDVASSQIGRAGRELTEEGIALLTGVSVAEVREVANADTSRVASKVEATHPLAVLLGAWHTDPRYTGPYGVLRDLPFTTQIKRDTVSFSELAREYCPGLEARAMLAELVAAGCVQKLGDDYYRAVKRTYVHAPLSEKSIMFLARTVHNLCETMEINQREESAGGKGLMQRTIYTRFGLSKKDLAEFNAYIRVRGQTFADDIDNWLTERDTDGTPDVVKTGVSFYHYTVTDDDETALLNNSVN